MELPSPAEFSLETIEELLLRTDLAYFAETYLDMEISQHHQEWSRLVAENNRLAINAPRDHGKTARISTTYALMTDGTRKRLTDIRPGDKVLALGDDWKLHERSVEYMQRCGLKPCVRIKTQTGREIEPALTHPFRKYEGWTKAGDLRVGDRIAVPRNLPLNLPDFNETDLNILLLGHIIANGCLSHATSNRRFYIQSQKYKHMLLQRMDHDGSAYEASRDGLISIDSDIPERYGLLGHKSIDKKIPAQVFKFSNRQLALFLGHLWSDGDVTFVERNYRGCKGQVNIDLCMGSEELIKDVQHLLLRLGMLSTFAEKTVKYIKKDGSTAKAWRVSVTGKENQLRWFELVGIHLFGEDGERCIPFLNSLDANSQNDQIPHGWQDKLKHSAHWHRHNSGLRIDNRYEIGRDKLQRLASAEDNGDLKNLSNSDILWDEIVSIEDIGEHECGDIQVEGDHNYVANDIVTHNSFFFSFAYVIWRIYYAWIPDYDPTFKSFPRRPIGYIFSSSQENAIKFLDIVKAELESNPKLNWLLPPRTGTTWNKGEIVCSNGATVRARGWGVAVRGGHPAWVVADDVLNDENIYSDVQRRKTVDYFFSAVTPMVIPGGQIAVVGCVHPDTYVLTKDGPTRIGDLAGSEDLSSQQLIDFNKPVFGENGWQTATKYWINGRCKTKKITTTYGLSIESSHRHPIRVRKGAGPSCRRDVVWKRADEITVDDKLLVEIGQNVYGDGFDNVDLAYFMGLWTAEGSSEPSGRLTICTSDADLLSYLDSQPFGLKFSRHQNKSRVQNKEFYDHLSDLGVVFKRAEHKEVPLSIMRGSKRAQAAFIRGFADGDGCSYVNDSLQQINLSSASEKLIIQLRAMLLNMGMLPSYQVKPPGISDLVIGKFDSHQLVLSSGHAYQFMTDIGFTVTHKKKEMLPPVKIRTRLFVGIKSIEDGETETVDFVIPDDHTFCSNGFISHNTPFHKEDLYASLAENVEYKFERFSSILEDGSALWPGRYSRAMLDQKKREVGSTRFTREYLCIPISDANSLFPDYILSENYRPDLELVTEMTPSLRNEYQLYTGVDLALSATVGADFTVITTIGVDKFKNYRLFDIRRFKGRTMTEQLHEIEDVYRTYRSNVIYIEDNQFQRVFADELTRRTDIPVTGFTTTAHNKNSLERGVPSLQILFENKKFLIPRKTERCRRVTDELMGELKCFTFVDGKLQGLGSHDDCLRKGSLIQTVDGLRPIETIKVGDLVLTHTGQYSPVTNFIKKPFKGKSYKIHPFGSDPVEVTGEHPIYAATKRGSAKGGDFYNPKWIAAEDVVRGKHRLMFPVNSEVKDVPFIDLMKTCDLDVEEDRNLLFYKNYKDNTVERFLEINDDFCRFIGIYLAEGYCRANGQGSLAFHIRERDLACEASDYLESIGVKTKIESHGKSLTVNWSNKILGSFLYGLGKHDSKKLPKEFLFIEPALQHRIYEYWLKGDGWNNIGATTSIDLANQMYIFLLRNGVTSNIRRCTRSRYGVKTKDQWWVEVNKGGDNAKSRLFNGHRYSAIKRIDVSEIDENVYNIEVLGDESYVVNQTIVHNCVMSLWIAKQASESSGFSFTF